MEPDNDPHNLARFVLAQEDVYERALGELRRGKKETHWIWYILPQIEGLGKTRTAVAYSIKCLDEAKDYLAHPVLGPRLLECFRALLAVDGKTAMEIMGYPDNMKLRSSATLFLQAGSGHPEFQRLLDKYYDGVPDQRTIALLEALE